ncbi:MAG TPA: DUF1841 family protein [Anaerolineae bacterium]
MSEDPHLSQIKSLNRLRMQLIWQTAQAGGDLDDEDALLAQIMREHPEWYPIWERLDQLSDAELENGGVNPVMHVTVHQVILNQINGALPAAGEVYGGLLAAGINRHEAIHRIGAVFMAGLWEVLHDHRPFDEAKYLQNLKQLLADTPPSLHRRRPQRRR